MRGALSPLLWAAVGGFAYFVLAPRPSPEPRYETVVVTRTQIEEHEPDTVVRWRERIVTRVVTADVVARAPGAGAADVAEFCRPTVVALTDTVQAPLPPASLLLRSGSTHPGWFFGSTNVILTGPTSHGDLVQAGYSVHPGWSFRANGDSLIVRSPRFWWLREGLEALAWIGVGRLAAEVF